jgi:hypothetical protein
MRFFRHSKPGKWIIFREKGFSFLRRKVRIEPAVDAPNACRLAAINSHHQVNCRA